MTWSILDILLAIALLIGLLHGAARGVGRTVGGLVGLLLGGAAALALLPHLEIHTAQRSLRLLILGVVLVVVMLLGQVLGEAVLGRVLGGPPRESALVGGLDRLGGALIGLTSSALLVTAVVGSLGSGPVPWLGVHAAESRVMQAIERATPPAAARALDRAGERLAGSAAVRELDTLLFAPVPAPAGEVEDPEILAAAESVVQIRGLAPACGTQQSGSGFVAPDGRVVTNAHVVSGTRSVSVLEVSGRRHPAEVVAFDPDADLAVLSVPSLRLPALEIGETPGAGASAAFAGYPQARPLEVGPAQLQGSALTSMSSIDATASAAPVEVLQFAGAVEQGSSGGPLLDPDGRVIGVVFAESSTDETGFAVTTDALEEVLADSAGAQTPVPTGTCAPLEAG